MAGTLGHGPEANQLTTTPLVRGDSACANNHFTFGFLWEAGGWHFEVEDG